MSRSSPGEGSNGRREGSIQGLGLHSGLEHLHLQWDRGDHQLDREAPNRVEQEVAVAVEFGVEEEDGDHLLDPRLVGGRAAQGALLATDVEQRGIWSEIVRCRIRMFVISVDSRAT